MRADLILARATYCYISPCVIVHTHCLWRLSKHTATIQCNLSIILPPISVRLEICEDAEGYEVDKAPGEKAEGGFGHVTQRLGEAPAHGEAHRGGEDEGHEGWHLGMLISGRLPPVRPR